MEEVRLWKLLKDSVNGPSVARIDGVDATESEALLEQVLMHSPDVLMDGLTIIGRQNGINGGSLDLLGVDDEGRLVVFELKRGELTRLAVAQVIDYASCLSEMEPEELDSHITQMSGRYGVEKIDGFADWYRTAFGKSPSDLGRPRMVLVGLGADSATKRMVEFLTETGVDISLITFYGFQENGQTLLARQVEVQTRRNQTKEVKGTRAGNEERLKERLQQCGLEQFYQDLSAELRAHLGDAFWEWPNPSGHTYYFPERADSGAPTNRAYVGFDVSRATAQAKKLSITLQARVVDKLAAELNDVAKRLGTHVVTKPAGTVDLVIDATQPVAAFSAGLGLLGSLILKTWEQRRAEVQSTNDPSD
jgi:hypothetical protein